MNQNFEQKIALTMETVGVTRNPGAPSSFPKAPWRNCCVFEINKFDCKPSLNGAMKIWYISLGMQMKLKFWQECAFANWTIWLLCTTCRLWSWNLKLCESHKKQCDPRFCCTKKHSDFYPLNHVQWCQPQRRKKNRSWAWYGTCCVDPNFPEGFRRRAKCLRASQIRRFVCISICSGNDCRK